MSIIPSAPINDTTTALTPEREQEIIAREQAATPGPWESDGAEIYGTLGGILMLDLWVGETLDVDNQDRSNADAAFIADARSAVPELLAEVADLRAALAEQAVATKHYIRQIRMLQIQLNDRPFTWDVLTQLADGLATITAPWTGEARAGADRIVAAIRAKGATPTIPTIPTGGPETGAW
ncbi:MAG: hypothetical protein ACRDQ0_01845 [Pseudonocardia sp.]